MLAKKDKKSNQNKQQFLGEQQIFNYDIKTRTVNVEQLIDKIRKSNAVQ